MPKSVIERNLPGAGMLSPQELHAIAQRSCGVLKEMGPQIQWVQSYVTHAKQGGFHANAVSRVRSVIDPTTAE